jgi:glycosyltransferase involved in cell wall biosynthesis
VSPAVTVLMPVYNGERFVREAIASILRQTWSDFEFLIVDDGSTDGTPGLLASFRDPRIRVLTNASRQGVARALNRGVAAASAALVARHDADDVSHPKRLETQLAFLRANPAVALLGAQIRVLDARGRISHPPGWRTASSEWGIRFQSMFDNPFIHPSVVFRRDVAGGYDPSLESAEDFDLWSRVAERCPVRNLPQRLVDFRVHAASTAARFDAGHITRSRAIVERNLRRYLALRDLPEAWSRAITPLHVAPHARGEIDVRELLPVVDAIHERFMECHPEERGNRDIRRVVAAKFGQIACLLAARHRRLALHTFGRASKFDPGMASTYATRFFALLAFGERARGWRRR